MDNVLVSEVSSGIAAWSLTGVGAASLVGVVSITVSTGHVAAMPPSVLAASFLVAGSIGARARPDHPGIRLLSAVGAMHLFAFATAAWVATGQPAGWVAWGTALLGDLAFGVGFLCLALLLATYPDGIVRTAAQRWLARLGGVWVLVAVVVEALSARAELALTGSVPRPWSRLPLDAHVVSSTPLLVVGGVIILVVRARRASGPGAASMGWAKLAGVVLALLLLATPAAFRLLSTAAWGAIFIGVVSTLPFVLLAGLVRHRLLEVDVYIVRTLARGTLGLAVVTAYALAVAVAARHVVLVAVVLTLLGAVLAGPALSALERLADRWVTGGKVGQRAVLRSILDALASRSPEDFPAWLARAIREGLDVSGVQLRTEGQVLASSGQLRHVALSVPLRVAGLEVATLECGRRRGGWGRDQRQTLQAVAPAIALAVRDVGLSEELRDRVEELSRSRARLVQAEDTARQRVERDLHDGAQQQLVALLALLGVAAAMTEDGSAAARPLKHARELAVDALADLRTLVTGIYPPVLADRGLVAAIEARADLMPFPVRVDADQTLRHTRFARDIESAAYFVVSEALTNVIKHAGVDGASVAIVLDDTDLHVTITDAGSGAVAVDGSGLAGLRDRVHALGGTFPVEGAPGSGTTVMARLRVAAEPA
ncbi:MAG: sensor histidine kinase [Mycobacteriaceae bacterium]